MKSLFIALLAFSSLTFAQSHDHAKIAETTVVNLFGKAGDQVSVEGVGVRNSSFDVTLTNGADAGSVIYNVEIDQTPSRDEGGEIAATIKVRFVEGN